MNTRRETQRKLERSANDSRVIKRPPQRHEAGIALSAKLWQSLEQAHDLLSSLRAEPGRENFGLVVGNVDQSHLTSADVGDVKNRANRSVSLTPGPQRSWRLPGEVQL